MTSADGEWALNGVSGDKIITVAAKNFTTNMCRANLVKQVRLIPSLRTRAVEKCFLSIDIRIILRVYCQRLSVRKIRSEYWRGLLIL